MSSSPQPATELAGRPVRAARLRAVKTWLRTNGVNTHGAAAKVMNFVRLGKKVRTGEDKSRLTSVPKKSLCEQT